MRAVYIKDFGGPENLEIREIDEPEISAGTDVLVRVRASALNRADILQRKGFYPAPHGFPERIPGLEFAGEIVETGDNVTQFSKGERVFGITAGGAQAELLVTDESLLVRIPDNLSFDDAAAVPEAFITAHDAVFSQGRLAAGETLLIHAVGSGVGLAALQIAKARGLRVFGTSRTAAKLDQCKSFGLDEGIVVESDEDFAAILRKRNDGRGADVILDLVGAGYFSRNLDALNLKGRLILVGLTAGTKTEFNLAIALAKRLTIQGTVLRSRPTEEKAAATREFVDHVVPGLVDGLLKPNIDRVFPLDEIRAAHEYLETNASLGKVVIKL